MLSLGKSWTAERNIIEMVVSESKSCQSGLDCWVVCFKCCWWFESSVGERLLRSSVRMLEEKDYPMGTFNLSRLSSVDVGLCNVDVVVHAVHELELGHEGQKDRRVISLGDSMQSDSAWQQRGCGAIVV